MPLYHDVGWDGFHGDGGAAGDHDFTAVIRGDRIPGYYTRRPNGSVGLTPTLFRSPPEGATPGELREALRAVRPADVFAFWVAQ